MFIIIIVCTQNAAWGPLGRCRLPVWEKIQTRNIWQYFFVLQPPRSPNTRLGRGVLYSHLSLPLRYLGDVKRRYPRNAEGIARTRKTR